MGTVFNKNIFKGYGPKDRLVIAICTFNSVVSLLASVPLFLVGYKNLAPILLVFSAVHFFIAKYYLVNRAVNFITSCILVLSALNIGVVSWVTPQESGILDLGLFWLVFLPFLGNMLNDKKGFMLGLALQGLVLAVFLMDDLLFTPANVGKSGYWRSVVITLLFHAAVPCLTAVHQKITEWSFAVKAKKSDTLLKIVAHDIANPLTVISGLTETLLTVGGFEPKISKLLQKVAKSSNDIKDILERVKTIQTMKSEQLQLRLGPVSLQGIFKQVEETFEVRFQHKELTFNWSIENYEDLEVMAEITTFRNDVINNLISNAIKFTERGKAVTMSARVNNDAVEIEVRDQGVGMTKAQIEDAFDDFVDTTSLGTEGEEGTGFGLPIVKHLVKAYNGQIEVHSKTLAESSMDHGTTFKITVKKGAI